MRDAAFALRDPFDPRVLRMPGSATFRQVHLQWFAAEDEGRTEEPSEHKLRKAREEGRVARSAEVPAALLVLVGIFTISLLSGYLLRTMLAMVTFFLGEATSPDAFSRALVVQFMSYLARIAAPILLVLFVVAIAGSVVQVGFLFSAKPISPDFSRAVPHFGRWLQRAFASGEAAFNLGKSVAKIAIIASVAWLNISAEVPRLVRLAMAPFFAGVSLVSTVAFRIVVEAGIALLAFAALDYWFQRRQYIESLKMSRQELKEERRMYEGDPLVRSRLRERMREIMRRNMLKAVPRADVVVTNPTHYAVALEYDRTTMVAPTVTAKGADLVAERIREIAREHGVAVVENRPLAQALWREVEIGDVIPEKYYEVISIVLAQVYRMSGKTAAVGAAGAAS